MGAPVPGRLVASVPRPATGSAEAAGAALTPAGRNGDRGTVSVSSRWHRVGVAVTPTDHRRRLSPKGSGLRRDPSSCRERRYATAHEMEVAAEEAGGTACRHAAGE